MRPPTSSREWRWGARKSLLSTEGPGGALGRAHCSHGGCALEQMTKSVRSDDKISAPFSTLTSGSHWIFRYHTRHLPLSNSTAVEPISASSTEPQSPDINPSTHPNSTSVEVERAGRECWLPAGEVRSGCGWNWGRSSSLQKVLCLEASWWNWHLVPCELNILLEMIPNATSLLPLWAEA